MKEALAEQGFALWPGRLDAAALMELERLFDTMPLDRPGLRIAPAKAAALHACQGIQDDVRRVIGPEARVVRALLFDKSDTSNWALGWHQDRTIEVAERIDVAGYGPWTVKQGRLHVAPPIDLIETMLTVRFHLDPVGPNNAPLEVAPGSHQLGFIAEDRIANAIDRCGTATCLADAGQVWFYSTPILHASARSVPGSRRRVLQLDYAATDLPGGLRWAADDA